MSDKEAIATGEVINDESGLVPMTPTALATWDAILSAVPEADDAAVERMLELIAAARSVGELDAPWVGNKAADLVNVPISISAVQQMPSDFDSGFGTYFVVRASRSDDGSDATFSTGAMMVLWQLANACALERANPGSVFPFTAILREARKARPGRKPAQHLEIVR